MDCFISFFIFKVNNPYNLEYKLFLKNYTVNYLMQDLFAILI